MAALIGMTRVIFEVDGYLLACLCVLFEQVAVVVAVAGENYLRAEVAVGHSVNPEGSLIARDMRADENIFSAESVGDDKIGLEPAITELLAPFVALFDGVKKAVLRDAVETLEGCERAHGSRLADFFKNHRLDDIDKALKLSEHSVGLF